jgi:hypothetical protein
MVGDTWVEEVPIDEFSPLAWETKLLLEERLLLGSEVHKPNLLVNEFDNRPTKADEI